MVGVWYGKAPGVDRAGDPLRHGNMCGAHPSGGVLVLAGDDPSCKSSTIPCISERTLAGYGLPVLYPGTAEEIVRLGRYGVALSRASGMWVGMKITADVADGVFALDGSCGDVAVTVPELEWEGAPWSYRQYPMLVPPGSLEAEAQMYGPRWAMVRAFLAANPINTVEVDAPEAWLGIVAGGKAFTDVRQALRDLGLDDDGLRARGHQAAAPRHDPPDRARAGSASSRRACRPCSWSRRSRRSSRPPSATRSTACPTRPP